MSNLSNSRPRPTVDELFETVKRTNIPTVLVEGKNDIIFYRKVEEDLREIGVDMLPAGNKDAVIELRRRLRSQRIAAPLAFIVDSDLWVHTGIPAEPEFDELITTVGYSIENDLVSDHDPLSLMSIEERTRFKTELDKFCRWYALAVHRHMNGRDSCFRTHPGKLLDNEEHYAEQTTLSAQEDYPEQLYQEIRKNFKEVIRGKSLLAIYSRQLSGKSRLIKYSMFQLMDMCASRRGKNYVRIRDLVRSAMQS